MGRVPSVPCPAPATASPDSAITSVKANHTPYETSPPPQPQPQTCHLMSEEPLFDALLRRAEARVDVPRRTFADRVQHARAVHLREFERMLIIDGLHIRTGFVLPLMPPRRIAAVHADAVPNADGTRRRARAEPAAPSSSHKRARLAKEEAVLTDCLDTAWRPPEPPILPPNAEEVLVCRRKEEPPPVLQEAHAAPVKAEARTPPVKAEEELFLDLELPEAGPFDECLHGIESPVSLGPADDECAAALSRAAPGNPPCTQSGRDTVHAPPPPPGSEVTADGDEDGDSVDVVNGAQDGARKGHDEVIASRMARARLRAEAAAAPAVRAPPAVEEEPVAQAVPAGAHYVFDGVGELPYRCVRCATRTSTSREMRAHLRREHEMFYGDIRPWHPAYMCAFASMHRCGRVFASLQRLNVHVAKMHPRAAATRARVTRQTGHVAEGAEGSAEEEMTVARDAAVQAAELDTCGHCGLRVPGRAPGAVIGMASHLSSHRWDGFLAEVNMERARCGKRPWGIGRVPTEVGQGAGGYGRGRKRRRSVGNGEVINLVDD